MEYVDLLDHLTSFKIKNLDEERNEIDVLLKNKDDPIIYFEDIKFKRNDHIVQISFVEFKEMIELILYEKGVQAILKTTGEFLKSRKNANELFLDFHNNFGPIISFKYYYFYIKTLKEKTECLKEKSGRGIVAFVVWDTYFKIRFHYL